MRLVDRLDKPLDTVWTRTINRDVLLLTAFGPIETPGKDHDLPGTLRNSPSQRAFFDGRGQIDERISINNISLNDSTGDDGDQVRGSVSRLTQGLGTLDRDRRSFKAFTAVLGWHASAHHLTGPPPVVIDDHG